MHAAIRSLEYSPSGYVSVDILTGETEQNLYFQLPPGTSVHTDTVAACVALLLSKSCRSLEFDFPISKELVSKIEMYCQARVRTKGKCSLEPPLTADIGGLAFSGGFDSLTANDFLPGAHELISLDFGGRFSRERAMFKEFGTTVVKTNLVDIGLNRNSWAFMAVGNTLMRDALGLTTLSFGTVLEARDKYLLRFDDQKQPGRSAMSELTKMPVFNPILGLTEVATALYVSDAYPDLVSRVLSSVAGPAEEKSYRKSLLVEAAAGRLGRPAPTRLDPPSAPTLAWGTNISQDFLSLYLIKHVGVEVVQLAYASPLPATIEEICGRLELSFHERVNPNFYYQDSHKRVARLFEKMISADIYPYGNKDFFEFSRVALFLERSRSS